MMVTMARRLLIVILAVIATGCSRTWTIYQSEHGRCTVRDDFTPEQVVEACGIPDGMRWYPKYGRLLSLNICSAPAYVYGPAAIVFDCDRQAAQLTIPEEMLRDGLDNVMRDAISSRHAVAALGELAHRTLSVAERERVLATARAASQNADPKVRRAAQRLIADVSSSK
jgi:hypothetical protein